MSTEPLDALLEKFTSGDHAAAQEVFLAYEPYLRMVVRRQLSAELRVKFDSMDIIQSVWLHLLEGFRKAGYRFANAAHLRAFLVQLTRHRFIDRLRRHRRAIEREESLDTCCSAVALPSPTPRPDETLEADELWQQLLELCPPAHREILHLKRAGALTDEVAAATGLHAGTVRRILGVLAQRLSLQQKRERVEKEGVA